MNKKGVSTILIVVIIMSSTFLMAVTASSIAFGYFDNSLDYHYSKKSLYIAEGCFENILRKIQTDNQYLVDQGSLSFGEGLCIITVAGSETDKSISVEGIFNNYHRRILATISLGSSKLNLTSYKIN